MDEQSLIGRTLDQRYVIQELIARGGMASVFRAVDERLDRVVAVKIMHPESSKITDSEQFIREAKLTARLNHRGIVSIHDRGTDGDLTYLVMEYVPGNTLRDVMREEAPMSPRRALAFIEPILVALSEAHANSLIHRDIKPENVLITPTGDVKVADFGLARAASVDHRTSSVLIGTVSYLAPEVIANQAVDPRADIYACGAIFYEMITGQKPHIADSPIAVAHKHINEDVAPPSSLRPDIPPYVDALAMRALARDRAQRSPDARTFLHQVRMVQRALAEGLTDDPELTADLMPGAGPTPAMPPTLPSTHSDTEATAPVSLGLADSQATAPVSLASDSEHTMAWDPMVAAPSSSAPRQRSDTPLAAPKLPQPPRRNKNGRRTFFVVLLLFMAAGIFGWWIGIGRFDETPDVTALPRDEAIKVIEGAGFETAFTPDAYSETIPKGAVVATDPGVGDRILPGDTVTMTLSKGKERYKIPDIKDKTLEEAQTILGSLNLQSGNISTEYHDTIPERSVIRSSSHKVGQEVKRDTAVDLVISDGPAPVEIVNYTGKTESEATLALKAAGLKVAKKTSFHDTVRAGTVISQSPKSGTGHRGDTITINVSKGPELIVVPDLDGLREAEARAKVEALGLTLTATRGPFSGSRATVRYQTPGAGAKVKRGSSVTVFIN